MTERTPDERLADAAAVILDACRTDEELLAEAIRIEPNGEAELNIAWTWGFGSKRNFIMLDFPARLRQRSDYPASSRELDGESDR